MESSKAFLRRGFGLLAAVSCLFAGVNVAGQEEDKTDIVFALDVSGSMRRDGNFTKVCDKLTEFIRNEVDLGARVAIVTFGDEARLVAEQELKSADDKAVLIKHIGKMRAESSATYLAGGTETALKILERIARINPSRSRMLILLTDGKNEPPKSIPISQQATFDRLLVQYKTRPDFRPNVDWFFWYCFIGSADDEVKRFAEGLGGESKPVSGAWQFLKVHFNRVLFKLPDMPQGGWTAEFPPASDRQLGDFLRVTTKCPGDYSLELSDVYLDDAEAGEIISVSPRKILMNKEEQTVVLKLTGTTVKPGERKGRILVRCPGKMVFVKPQQFHVRFSVVNAGVMIAPKEGLSFGVLTAGKSVERRIDFLPDDAARKFGSGSLVRVSVPSDLPRGVKLAVEPDQVDISKQSSVRVVLSADGNAALTGQDYKGVLTFSKIPNVSLDCSALPVSFESKTPKIDVTPGETLDFGSLETGESKTLSLWFSPDETASGMKPTVKLSHSSPTGDLIVSIQPQEIVLDRKHEVKVSVKAGQVEGKQSVKLGFSCTPAVVKMSASGLDGICTVESSRFAVDTEKLVFGDVRTGDSVNESVLRVAVSSGAVGEALNLKCEFKDLPAPMSVVLTPQKATVMKASDEIALKLNVTHGVAGSYAGQVSFSAGAVVSPSSIPVELIITEAEIKIEASGLWKMKNGLLGGTRQFVLPVVLRANDTAAGRIISLAEQENPEGVRITMSPAEIKIVAGENPVELNAEVSARPSLTGGVMTGGVRLKSDRADVVFKPEAVEWKISTPAFWVWIVVPGIIAVIIWRCLGPGKLPRTAVLVLDAVSGPVEVWFRGSRMDVQDSIKIGMLNKPCIWIGSQQGGKKKVADLSILQSTEVKPLHARIYRMARKNRIQSKDRVCLETDAGKIIWVKKNEKEVLFDGDKIKIGSVEFVFRCPGSRRKRSR